MPRSGRQPGTEGAEEGPQRRSVAEARGRGLARRGLLREASGVDGRADVTRPPRPLGNVYSLLHSQFKHLFHWDRGVWSSAGTKKPWLGLYISPSFRFSLGLARGSPARGYTRPMKVSEARGSPGLSPPGSGSWLVCLWQESGEGGVSLSHLGPGGAGSQRWTRSWESCGAGQLEPGGRTKFKAAACQRDGRFRARLPAAMGPSEAGEPGAPSL